MVQNTKCDMCNAKVGDSLFNDYESLFLVDNSQNKNHVEICDKCSNILYNWIKKGNKL